MFFDKLRIKGGKGGSPFGKLPLHNPLPVLFSRLKQLTWVNELKTLATLATRRQALPVYGVDIGSSSVKILRLSSEEGDLKVTALAVASVADDAIVDGEIMNLEAVVDAVGGAMLEHEMEPGLAVTGLSGRSVIVKKISMEKTDPDLARETLGYDAAEHIPFEPGEVCLDLHILEAAPDAPTMDVLLVAAKRPVVDLYSEILASAGLTPAVVDVGTFALSNAYLLNYEPTGEENVGIVNIGRYVTNIAVIQGQTPWVMRDLAFGTHSFVEQLQDVLSADRARAREVLFGSPERSEPRLPEVVSAVGGDLVGEIERSLAFADSSGGGSVLSRMLLAGGGSRIEGLKDFLAEQLRIPVEIADPFQKFSWSQDVLLDAAPEDLAPRFMIAAGLALRGVGV